MSWKFFSVEEMRCKCGCERADMDPMFMMCLDQLRERCGFPLPVTSGFRCPEYNAQVSGSGTNGPHTTGCAVDIGVARKEARIVVRHSDQFSRLGINQKGEGRFIHLDQLTPADNPKYSTPIWTY